MGNIIDVFPYAKEPKRENSENDGVLNYLLEQLKVMLQNAYNSRAEFMISITTDRHEFSKTIILENLKITGENFFFEFETGCIRIKTLVLDNINYDPDDEGLETYVLNSENSVYEFNFNN